MGCFPGMRLLLLLSGYPSGAASAFSQYDDHGHVTGALRRLMSGTATAESDAVIPGQQFEDGYIGNNLPGQDLRSVFPLQDEPLIAVPGGIGGHW